MMADEMKRKFTGLDWWLKLAAGIVLLIAYLLILAWLLSPPAERDDALAPIRISAAEKRWVEQRHNYHGIWGSIGDENGNKYFFRDGRRCAL